MPSRRPSYIKGNYYHFFNRGAHKLSIFRDQDNYLFATTNIKYQSRKLNITLIAYCLLPNHYHLLVRQDADQPARLLPQYVFNSYSKAFNRRYAHRGTIFEDKYKVKHIENENHLLHLCRYIHANPVTHAIVSEIDSWPFSNYADWVGKRRGTLLDREFIAAHFHSQEEYKKFVQEYINQGKIPADLTAYLKKWEK